MKFIDESQGVLYWPSKREGKQIVTKWLSSKFKFGKKYSEQEVNCIISRYHSFNNIALLRRELIAKKLLQRENDGSRYWKNK